MMSTLLQQRQDRMRRIDLYPVISSEFTNGRPVTEVLKAIADGGARIVQLREKNCTERELYKLAEAYRRITAQYDMLLIVDDHLDIALAVGADGVHLGQDDLPIPVGRRIAPDLLLGSSTHNLAEAQAALADDAGYINIGPVFPTQTKNVSYPPVGLEQLQQIIPHVKIPFSVMGGIKERHLAELIAAGATRIAMVTEITQAPDITAKVKQLRAYWKR